MLVNAAGEVTSGVAEAWYNESMVFRLDHDEEFVGVTPGLLPADGQATTRRVRGGKEWHGTVAVQFHPPVGVGPALLGTLIDGVVQPRDVGAMLIDLSLRGWFGIEREGEDWVFVQSPPPPGDAGLSTSERLLLRAIFRDGERVRLSELKPRLAAPIRAVTQNLYREVVARGWYRRHPRRRGLTGRSPRTATGTAVRIQGLGFQKYLTTAEANQIKVEEAEGLFSRYLPYAMAFGVASHWAGVMSQVMRQARLEDALVTTADVAGTVLTDSAMWLLLDGLDVGEMVGGLAEALAGADGLIDLDGVADVVGDVLGDLLDSVDLFD